jgi:Xaa-Pro aminopeptidase
LLSQAEKAWLNAYHDEVRNRLVKLLGGKAKDWLLRRTEAI